MNIMGVHDSNFEHSSLSWHGSYKYRLKLLLTNKQTRTHTHTGGMTTNHIDTPVVGKYYKRDLIWKSQIKGVSAMIY